MDVEVVRPTCVCEHMLAHNVYVYTHTHTHPPVTTAPPSDIYVRGTNFVVGVEDNGSLTLESIVLFCPRALEGDILGIIDPCGGHLGCTLASIVLHISLEATWLGKGVVVIVLV